MSEDIKALLIEAVNLLRRMAGPPPAVPAPPTPPPAVPEIPPVEISFADILKGMETTQEGLESILEKLDEIGEALGVPPYYTKYMTEKSLPGAGSVSSKTPVDQDISKILGRKARYGYIYSETGTLIIKINSGAQITLKAADFFDIHDQHLEVEKLRIETESVVDIIFRLLLV